MSYDRKCLDLASSFLSDHEDRTDDEQDELAQVIQDAIEDWFSDRAAPARKPATAPARTSPGPVNCNEVLWSQGKPYPRTCGRCGLGPCPFFDKEGNSK